jgi:hypothetical protein
MRETGTADQRPTENEPTLSQLLAEEIRSETGTARRGDVDEPEGDVSIEDIEVDELPAEVSQLLSAVTFAEPVREEADWLIAHGALLPVTTRTRLLIAVDRALRVREADETAQQDDEGPFADVPDEFEEIATELEAMLDGVASRQVAPDSFAVDRVVELVRGAGVDPVVVYAACKRSIRSAQRNRPRHVGVLGSHSEDEWEDLLRELQRLILSRQDDNPTGT